MTDTSLIIKRPIVTERATDLNKIGKYVFMVQSSATKPEIKKAVRQLYKVDVLAVHVVNRPPKSKRYRGIRGRAHAYKKAIVTLKAGQKIE